MLQVKVNVGEMDKRITFIRKVIQTNDFNEDGEESWTEVASNPTVFARVRQKPGKELMTADRVTYVQHSTFSIRYRSDITVMNRVVYEGRPYNIISIVENGESRKMYLDVLGELIDNETWT